MMNEPLSSIMTRNVITVGPDEKLSVARDVFMKHRVHHLPVVNGKRLIGIVTTYDLFKFVQKNSDYDTTLVRDVMTTHLATLEAHDKVGSAAELFLENLFHAVPVVEGDELIGIVTSFDVIKYEFKKEYPTQPI